MAISDIKINTICDLVEFTDLTYEEIGKKVGCGTVTVKNYADKNFQAWFIRDRARRTRSQAQAQEKSYRWKGKEHVDSKGYRLVLTPDWYTGANHNTGKVYEHVLVMCKHLDVTRIPYGYEVHHKDENRLNNSIDNLELLSTSDHMRLHHAQPS